MRDPQELTSEFLDAFQQGRVCIHPTDTVPGLTWDSQSEASRVSASKIKPRGSEKAFIGLVSSYEIAEESWEELPSRVSEGIRCIWPGPVSVIAAASSRACTGLLHESGTIALRCPRIPDRHTWFADVMDRLGRPLPTTSINLPGQKPARSESEIAGFAARFSGLFVPDVSLGVEGIARPSTIIRVTGETEISIVREGACAVARIEDAFEGCHVKIHTS